MSDFSLQREWRFYIEDMIGFANIQVMEPAGLPQARGPTSQERVGREGIASAHTSGHPMQCPFRHPRCRAMMGARISGHGLERNAPKKALAPGR